MSEEKYHEGDLVEAVKGESSLKGRVTKDGALEFKHLLGDSGVTYRYFLLADLALDHEITVIEKAKPPLPTGMYTAILASVTGRSGRCILFLYGDCWIDGSGRIVPVEEITSFDLKTEPVAETAKKITEWLWSKRDDIKASRDSDDVRGFLHGIDNEFGVGNE